MIKTIIKRWLLFLLIVVLTFGSIEIIADAAETNTTEYEIYVILATSNLRAEPSKEGRWITTIPSGAYVILLDMTDTDIRLINYYGVEGYIYRGCIKKLEGNELKAALIELGLDTNESAADLSAKVPAIALEYQNGNRKIDLLQKQGVGVLETQEKVEGEDNSAEEDFEENGVSTEDADESIETEEDAAFDSSIDLDSGNVKDIVSNQEEAISNGHCSVSVKDIVATGSNNQSDSTAEGINDTLKNVTNSVDTAKTKRQKRQEQLDSSLNSVKDNTAVNVTEILTTMDKENQTADSLQTVEAISEEIIIDSEAELVVTEDAALTVQDALSADSDLPYQDVESVSEIIYGHVGTNFVGMQNKADEEEKTYEQAKIRTNAVLRTLPSANSKKKLTVPKDATVTIIDDGENGYLHVLYEQEEGYVIAKATEKDGTRTYASGILDTIVAEENNVMTSPILTSRHRNLSLSSKVLLNYIQQEENITVETQELTAGSEAASISTLTNSDIDYQIRTRANMRLTPSQAGDWVTTLPTGANVNLLGETSNGYTLVQYNGIQGYVLESVVVDSVDLSTISSEGAVLFSLTAYCSCAKCCGSYSPEVTGRESHTATGTVPMQGRTIAVDPKVIPYGSVVHIEGMGDYIAEDCGGGVKGNHIDVYFDSHEEALQFGRQKRYVSIN